MTFLDMLDRCISINNSLLCVGLDPDLEKIPDGMDQFSFTKAIVDATHDLVCCYKPNSAFFEADGANGIENLKRTCSYIKQAYPEIPIILDFKRGDIGNTNNHYARFAFDYLGADAVTVQSWQGREAIQPFLDWKDKGIIVWCKASNPGSGEFQDLELKNGRTLYMQTADNVKNQWNGNGNCLLVVGATYPKELAKVREIVGNEMVLLVPGLGTQGGDAAATLQAGLNTAKRGLIINSSREVLYASDSNDFAKAGRNKAIILRDQINTYR